LRCFLHSSALFGARRFRPRVVVVNEGGRIAIP
jgi:hypothetical protein